MLLGSSELFFVFGRQSRKLVQQIFPSSILRIVELNLKVSHVGYPRSPLSLRPLSMPCHFLRHTSGLNVSRAAVSSCIRAPRPDCIRGIFCSRAPTPDRFRAPTPECIQAPTSDCIRAPTSDCIRAPTPHYVQAPTPTISEVSQITLVQKKS